MNPDIAAFVKSFDDEIVFGQVVIRRMGNGFELRHQADSSVPSENLIDLKGTELRAWTQTAERGAFRPLKSAPNLRPGWRAAAMDGEALGLLLHYVYPGAVADWFAAGLAQPPVTSYRGFTARQTGMYRITTMLSDEIAGAANLVLHKAAATPFALVRGLDESFFGPGSISENIVRSKNDDLFR